MRTLNWLVVGRTPLILHQVSKHQNRGQIASHGRAEMTLEEEADAVMSKDDNGNPVVPASWLSDAIRAGCKKILIEGKQLSYFRLKSSIYLPAGYLPLVDTDGGKPAWSVYKSIQHKAPKSTASIAVIAPMFKDWMFAVRMSADDHYPDDDLLQRVFIEAGKVGIGLFHPPKKQFGQFSASLI